MKKGKWYPNTSIINEGNEGYDLQILINLILSLPELIDNVPSHSQQIEVTPILATVNQNVGPPQCILELLQRLSSFRIPLHLRNLETLQQVPDQLEMPSKLPAVLLVHSCCVGSLHYHSNQLHRIESG